MAKYAAAEAATAAVDAAIQVHGGNGLSVEYGLMPLWGMARLLRIAPVNSEMVLNYVAQHSLKLPRRTDADSPSRSGSAVRGRRRSVLSRSHAAAGAGATGACSPVAPKLAR